jgi:transaldolase
VKEGNPEKAQAAQAAIGEVAIASAKMAYQLYKKRFESERFKKLIPHGAQPQRLLWASTSSKNPKFSDVKYVEALIGPNTVNTVPMETLDAYRDHGKPVASLENGLDHAERILNSLPGLAVDLAQLTAQLEKDGIDKFVQPFQQLMESITEKSRAKGVPIASSRQ